jgi:hypothetical protein
MNSDWTKEVETEVEQDFGQLEESDKHAAYVEAVERVYEMYKIQCPLHVWDNGFEQGDASDEEVIELATRLHQSYDEDDLASSELFLTLNGDLKTQFQAILEKLAKDETS